MNEQTKAERSVERSRATLQMMDAVAAYFPHLIKANKDGSTYVVPYRFGVLCRVKFDHWPYLWVRGDLQVSSSCLRQVVYEILAVAQRERSELLQLREELELMKGNASAKTATG